LFRDVWLSCSWGVLIGILIVFFDFSITSSYVLSTFALLILSLLGVALHVRPVMAYQFFDNANGLVFSITATGSRQLAREDFVQQIVQQIRKVLETPMTDLSQPSQIREAFSCGTAVEEHTKDMVPSFPEPPLNTGCKATTPNGTSVATAYRWSNMFAYGEVSLGESTISIRRVRRLRWSCERTFFLNELQPEYVITYYRRKSFAWTTLLSVCFGLCWCVAMFDHASTVGPIFAVGMPLLSVAIFCFAITQFPLVTSYHFNCRSGSNAFSVFALGPHHRDCHDFVLHIVRSIAS
jgi:hypothetical protein